MRAARPHDECLERVEVLSEAHLGRLRERLPATARHLAAPATDHSDKVGRRYGAVHVRAGTRRSEEHARGDHERRRVIKRQETAGTAIRG